MERELSCTGVTMHKVAQRLDGGDVLAQHTIDITADTDSIDVYLQSAAWARGRSRSSSSTLTTDGLPAGRRPEKQPYWKRPASALLTLHPEMSRAEALAIFQKYNSMTQVELGGAWFYVTAVEAGTVSLPCGCSVCPPRGRSTA